jgi:hypothetical protein
MTYLCEQFPLASVPTVLRLTEKIKRFSIVMIFVFGSVVYLTMFSVARAV